MHRGKGYPRMLPALLPLIAVAPTSGAVFRGRFVRYRVRFGSQRGARYPRLDEVEIVFD